MSLVAAEVLAVASRCSVVYGCSSSLYGMACPQIRTMGHSGSSEMLPLITMDNTSYQWAVVTLPPLRFLGSIFRFYI